MELGQLRHFLAVIDNGSIGDAARKLGLSQGAMSKSIQVLEASVQTPLFERSRQGMILTSFGKALESRARSVAAEVTRAQEELYVLSKGKTGRLSFGIGTSSAGILPDAIERFVLSHSKVQLDIREGFYKSLLPLVATGELEFALFMAATDFSLPGLISEMVLADQRVVIVASSSNPLARRRYVSLEDIWAGPWIFPSRDPQARDWLIRAFRRRGLEPPVPNIAISAGTVVAKIITANPTLLCTVPELKVHDELKSGSLCVLPVEVPTDSRDLRLYYRDSAVLSEAAKSFVACVRAACTKFPNKSIKGRRHKRNAYRRLGK